jgi:hypothetical protein
MIATPATWRWLFLASFCAAFAPSAHFLTRNKNSLVLYASEDWVSLVRDDNIVSPVRKLILEEGKGGLPSDGSTVELEYKGKLVGEKHWTVQDVVECWLSTLQGLDHLSSSFFQNNVDFSVLTDENIFTEEYCATTLGVTNKIQAKKLIMAAKRLSKSQAEYGKVFDSSTERGKNFSFVLGGGKAIKAIDLAARSMQEGEKSSIVCRCDYAYGSEGLRTSKGTVLVPPFATLNFELKRVC